MGFTTGFVCSIFRSHSPLSLQPSCVRDFTDALHQLGGLTLTTSLVYLSLLSHRQNRVQQAHLLRQQATVLNSIIDPAPAELPQIDQEVRGGVLETAKDRWNTELEHLVRRAYNTDWGRVREGVEQLGGQAWRRLQGQVEEVNKSL